MGKGGGKTVINQPDPVDPYDSANAQLGMNYMTSLSNLYGNRIEQATPYGSLSYETKGYTKIDPKTGQVTRIDRLEEPIKPLSQTDFANNWGLRTQYKSYQDYANNFYANSPKYIPNQVQTVKLSPQQQRIVDLQQKQDVESATINNTQMNRVGRTLGENFNPNLQAFNAGNMSDFSKDREKVENAVYARFDKRFAKEDEAMRARLANQGIPVGSDAWKAENEAFNQAKNDARTQAVLAGGDEQSRLVGIEQNRASFQNQMRNQQLQEALTRRSLPLNEYASLRSGQQVQNPSFQPFYQMNLQGGDIQGAMQNQFEQQMSKYNASVAEKNNAKSGTNDLIKTGAMAGAMAFSDPLLKTNIEKVANIRGHNIYKYTMIKTGKTEIGVMADEIAVLRPDCVKYDDDGFLMVNYQKLFPDNYNPNHNLIH